VNKYAKRDLSMGKHWHWN